MKRLDASVTNIKDSAKCLWIIPSIFEDLVWCEFNWFSVFEVKIDYPLLPSLRFIGDGLLICFISFDSIAVFGLISIILRYFLFAYCRSCDLETRCPVLGFLRKLCLSEQKRYVLLLNRNEVFNEQIQKTQEGGCRPLPRCLSNRTLTY